MFVQEEGRSKLSRGASRLVEAVEQLEDRLCAGPGSRRVFLELLRALLQLGYHRGVDLLVAEQDLAVELARALHEFFESQFALTGLLLAFLLVVQVLLVEIAHQLPQAFVLAPDELSKAFAAEHETYCRRPERTSYARNAKRRAPKAGSGWSRRCGGLRRGSRRPGGRRRRSA